tara:strand:- start:5057 stop:5419 length:363 start_codon:yes stop_codon:yes gene_type:complete
MLKVFSISKKLNATLRAYSLSSWFDLLTSLLLGPDYSQPSGFSYSHRRNSFIEKVGLFSQSLPSLGLCAGRVFMLAVVVGAGLNSAQYGLPAIAPSENPPTHQLASLLVSISDSFKGGVV